MTGIEMIDQVEAAEQRRENLWDLVVIICVFLVGILGGWRLHYLTHDYRQPDSIPHCTEDEYIDPGTFECIHIDTILEENK